MERLMRNVVCAGALLLSLGTAAGPEKAKNPIIWADVPDIAITRFGDTYYMGSTTMHMCPGLPIMKSKDLVNWKLVSYCYQTHGDSEQMNLQNGKNAYGRGTWASSLRVHNGTLYATTFSNTTGRTHIYFTKTPDKGNWKEISFAPAFHDHSLFFDDDGRVFLIFAVGDIRIIELKSDLTGVKPGGLDQVIVKNAGSPAGTVRGLQAEGSQMRKINGRYYLCNITWPSGGMRMEVIHRADKLTGPYEGRVMFRDRGIAQGGLIDTPDGKWYAYLFQDHGAVGRIPYLIPMTWEDGWPVAGVDGKAPEVLDIPGPGGVRGIVSNDEFKGKSLHLAWQWNHNPVPELWSLSERPGWLRIKTGRVDVEVVSARNTLTQRTFGPESSAVTLVDGAKLNDGDFAGMVALMGRYGWVGITKSGRQYEVVMTSAADLKPVELARVPIKSSKVFLRVDCDFKNMADKAYFYYSQDGKSWSSIGKPLQMRYELSHFMGCRFGLFNFATKSPGGAADFDFYRVGDKILPVL